MKNETLLNRAIELLQGINSDDTETVQIENTQYDDGSTGFNVSITYPSEDVETMSFYDGNNNEVVDVFKPEISG